MTEQAPPPDRFFDYVTVTVADQLLGLRIDRVQDVLIAQRITPVPLAPPEIVGLINLRGRIVTALSLRRRLGRPDSAEFPEGAAGEAEAVGIEHGGEAYALIVDAVGEVLHLDAASFEALPVHLDRRWAALATGLHRLQERLMLVLDVDAVLAIDLPAAA